MEEKNGFWKKSHVCTMSPEGDMYTFCFKSFKVGILGYNFVRKKIEKFLKLQNFHFSMFSAKHSHTFFLGGGAKCLENHVYPLYTPGSEIIALYMRNSL